MRAERPLHLPPAVVPAAAAARRLEIDLLARVLADVADVEIARRRIEAHPPGIAQAEIPDLVGAALADERVVVRDAVVPCRIAREIVAVDVEPQDLAEEDVQVLGVVGRIAAGAAVADRPVEVAVVRARRGWCRHCGWR